MVTDPPSRPIVLFGEPLAVFATYEESLATATSMVVDFGGSELNTAIGLARLDLQPVLFTALGSDPFSARVRELAKSEGVSIVAEQIEDRSLGAMVKDGNVPAGADTFYLRNQSAFATATDFDLDSDVTPFDPIWCHTSGITWAVNPSATEEFLTLGGANGATVSFDANLRSSLHPASAAKTMFQAIRETVDVLLLSRSEALTLTDADSLDDALAILGNAFPRSIIRHGSEPVLVIDDGSVSEIPVVVVSEVDPIGAGDAFNAGLIAGLVSGLDLNASCRLAIELGAEMVRLRGDWGFANRKLVGVLGPEDFQPGQKKMKSRVGDGPSGGQQKRRKTNERN